MSKAMPTKWSGKEIGVTIGYAFLILLCFFAGDCLGFLGPFFWVYGVPIMLLVAGIPYFYIAAREQRYGTFTIVGVLFLLYGLLSGALINNNAGALKCVLFLVAVLVAAALGAYIAKAVLRKPLTKYGMLKGAAPVEAPKEA